MTGEDDMDNDLGPISYETAHKPGLVRVTLEQGDIKAVIVMSTE